MQYDGTNYCGWQRQNELPTIQKALEEAASQLELQSIKAFAAGRTDAGVHAAGQVVHFDCSKRIPDNRWASAINGRLPSSIRVLEAVEVSLKWHACYSATNRRYRYTIYNGQSPNLFLTRWTWHRYQIRLDEKIMQDAVIGLIGSHDFAAFQKAGSKRLNSWTTIEDVQIKRNGDLISLEIQATGFLYGMVRLLMGQLIALGEKRLTINEFSNRWKKCLRSEVKESAPAKGLCLLKVGYEESAFSRSIVQDSMPEFLLSETDSPRKI